MSAAPHSKGQARGDHSGTRPIRSSQGRGTGYEGRVLGGFRLARQIASGGMATVYLAHRAQHARIGQAAAVKVIHPHLARDTDFVEMFLDEARIASCINHPNVCRVLDFGVSEGTYYLAMEYVMGETLADLLTQAMRAPEARNVTAALVTQIVAQACEGLHAAHDARDPQGTPLNVVHRDVSPQNIMIGYDGSVRVLDFGVASASERLHVTRKDAIKGRLQYMAPEQMRGQPIDRRADLWSLGVILWEGLAGQRLFRREDETSTIAAVLHEPLPSLASCERPVPASLQRIVARALQRDRDARYTTARELSLALSRSTTGSLPHVGMPEISAWMQSLFVDAIESKRARLREAAEAAAGGVRPTAMPRNHVDVAHEDDDEGNATRVAVPRMMPREEAADEPEGKERVARLMALLLLTTLLWLAWLASPEPALAPLLEEVATQSAE
jgi:serine/threonine-protein kinase